MSNKFFKKSLRLLALLAMVGTSQQVDAATLTGDDNVNYGSGSAFTPRNPTNTLIAAGRSAPSGAWNLGSEGGTYIVAQTSSNNVIHAGTISAPNNAQLFLQGTGAIDLSAATMAGPTTTGQKATLGLLNSPADVILAATRAGFGLALPAAASLTGNWVVESLNDAAVVDANAASNAMPSFTMKASKSVYFGGTRGIANACYATSFGGSASAVVTGPGTLKLGTAFTTFNPVFTAFTGTLETNSTSALTLGSSTYPVALGTSTLVINSSGVVTLGSSAPSVKRVISGNANAVLSGINNATIAIAELDLTAHPITLRCPASSNLTFNIAKITEGSDQPLTLDNLGASLTVKITAGRTDGGIIKSGTIGGINLTQP